MASSFPSAALRKAVRVLARTMLALLLFMMALPMWFLFEVGLLGSRFLSKPDADETRTSP